MRKNLLYSWSNFIGVQSEKIEAALGILKRIVMSTSAKRLYGEVTTYDHDEISSEFLIWWRQHIENQGLKRRCQSPNLNWLVIDFLRQYTGYRSDRDTGNIKNFISLDGTKTDFRDILGEEDLGFRISDELEKVNQIAKKAATNGVYRHDRYTIFMRRVLNEDFYQDIGEDMGRSESWALRQFQKVADKARMIMRVEYAIPREEREEDAGE